MFCQIRIKIKPTLILSMKMHFNRHLKSVIFINFYKTNSYLGHKNFYIYLAFFSGEESNGKYVDMH